MPRPASPSAPPLSHRSAVYSAAFSPDGKAVVTGSADDTARIWDAATGQPIGHRLSHQGAVHTVAFSPDGKAVLTGGQDKMARIWDAATGQLIGSPLPHANMIDSVAFSPDGKAVLTGSRDNTARLWDAATGKPIGRPLIHQGWVWSVAFSPDGKAVLTGGGDRTARLWDATTGDPIAPPLTHQGAVYSVAFSPDSKAVLTGSQDNTARLWDAATGKPIGPPLVHRGSVQAVAFSPDGRAVLTGSFDGTARLWAVSELPDDLPRVADWVSVVTGLELDEQGTVHALDNAAWHQLSAQLGREGGPPETGRRWQLDPILFGPEPTARARAWIERQRWAEAEAAAGYGQLVRLKPEDLALRRRQILLLGAAGELDRLQRARSDFLDRFGRTSDARPNPAIAGEPLHRGGQLERLIETDP